MNRREALLAVISIPMARFTAMGTARPQAPRAGKAYLTLNLDTWAGVEVTLGGKSVFVPAAEIFNALNKGE